MLESRDTLHRFVLTLRTARDAPADGNPQQPVTIPLLVTHMGGATTEDYEGLPASVTFGVGESEADFDLRAIPDQTKEIGEGLRLDFGALPPGVTKGTWGPYEIIEFLDEIPPWVTASFGAEAYTATEGGGAAGVSIHLSEPVDLEPLEVGLLLEYGGGATAADHGSIPEVVTFAVGEQTKTITVTATDDTDDDDGESVSLSFVNDPNDRVTTGGAATLALVDNDGPAQVMVSFGAATYTATEGGAAATVRVELDAAPGRAVTVPLPPVHVGGATAADYSGLPASVTFGANQTAQTFTVTATPDTDSDGGESVSIGFGALPPGVFAGHPASAAVTLADGSEQTLVVDFGTASNSNVIKVREGLVIHRFTLILDSAPQLPVTIPLLVTHVGGATAADYTELPASVTFGVGESVVGFDLRAIPDETKEIGEGLRLDFGTLPPGVTKGTWGPYETLEFVDVGAEQVMVSFGAATYTATEGGAAATVRVELDAAPGRPVTVPRATAFTTGTGTYTLSSVVIPLTTADVGGATAADYSGIPETVTFAANQTAVTFTVTATADTDADGGDSVSIGFGTLPAGVFAGSPATTVTLADDSGPGPTTDADPTVTISTTASPRVTGPFTVTIVFSESVNRFELSDLVVGNGVASELRGNGTTFTATITPAAAGTVTVDIPAGAAEDDAGNESEAASRFSIAAELADTTAPTVSFQDVPKSHDGATAFTVGVQFSGQPDGLSATRDAASVLEVTGGSVTGARVASKSADPAWEVTVVPDGLGEVTIEVPVRACTEANAVCIGGRSLSRAVETTVPGTPMTMTARFTQTPLAHDGSNGFELHMEFSHEPENFSYRTVQGALFDIEGGRIERVWRRERGKDRQWGMVVAPDGGGAVTLVARATSDCAAQNAVCDAEGGKFAGDLSLTVPGPASSSLPVVSIVASATPVTEGTAAAFTLSRTVATDAALTVTVSVSESEASVSGTPPTSVTFAAASASATLSVATEDDEVAEDASTVTATVSSGSGYTVSGTSGSADVVVEDDDATPVVTTASPIVVAENATSVATLSATDADTAAADLAWSIPAGVAGGADGAKFALTADGALSFKAAKDYEAPDDADADGAYEVTVRVTDGVNPVDAALVVRLEDADDDTGPTASFEALPERHDGTAAFRFELHFSEEPSGLSYRTVGGGLLEVTGGTLTHARRLTRGRNQGWEVTVVPTQAGDIVITLPARSCGEADAICIDGAPLARAATATVPGPASITPAASGTVTVDLPAGAAEDDAGNESEAASQFSIAAELDTTAPTVAISTAASAPVNGPFTVTFTFSEEVTGFELTDLVVGNGSSSALQGDGASYTATITPEASGTVTVDVPAGGAEDSAGNPSVAAQQFSIAAELTAVDDVAPRVTITGPATEPVIGPFSITVIFSEPVTGFELEDVVVGNGVASELEGDGARYTATVTPTAPGPVTVDIAAGAAEDSAGNPSTAADQFSITVELTPVPALPLAGVIALAALLLIGVIRRRAGDAV